jgi:lipopolysaccharide transport system ATP-binding protein
MSELAVDVKDVSICFNLSKERIDSFKEFVVKLFKGELMYDEFYALRNVSFEVKKGDSFGIIGANGSGKSTILKIISRILRPTTGDVFVNGSVAPLIELGAGFDLDLTARENIYLNGSVLGYSKRFMKKNFEDIIDFAELHEFVDVPIKNYSSGMIARLGFSIATLVRPDILIVDEILSVGDYSFHKKCEAKMNEILSGGTTLLLVTHELDQVRRMCSQAMWLDHGKQMMLGPANAVCDAYVAAQV